MKFQALRKSLLAGLASIATAVLLGSCGGGGASVDPLQGGTMSFMSPLTGTTYYAGIPVTMTIAGGRRPYAIVSSEPGIMAVPSTIEGNTFTVVPNNPGVIDTGIGPNDLPRRTVVVTARDAVGLQATVSVAVAQNFLTGYGVSFTSNCPTTGTDAASACSGGESAVRLQAVFNGSLAGNRQFRFEVLRGPFQFVHPGTNNTGNSVTTNSDHAGIVTTLIRVAAGVPTQLGVLRVIDVATGVYADHVFVITQGNPTSTTITAIPNTITFTGALSTECGTGIAEVLVFDGAAPYTATSTTPDLQVRRIGGSSEQPGRFEIRANNPGVCLDDAQVVITDANGARTVVTVDTARGSVTPTPPPAFAVAPPTMTLICGTSGSATVIGGSGQYAVASSHPRITAVVTGNTVTVTRLAGDGGTNYPTTGTVTVTDGTAVASITVTVPANCP